MYLKKIEASGFKSFADKITIELPKTITGIVGPNGSGKSNVVDAVRWVLGEQSIKSLRGDGNMADVIFSGSKSRKAMNVATVNLIFDNKDHYLNLPHDEVSIKRRVYRDGSNEYLINNEKCRLKDVANLLMDSGIAKESFNIISQGKIEEIISSKAVDRRIIFEEASGVLKYKTRKKDALRKLEKTHDNMNRLGDIIHELEERIGPLREQSKKAKIYQEKKEALEKIEIALIATDIHNLNFEYQIDKQRIDELNQDLEHITTTSTNDEVKIEQFKLELVKQNQKLTSMQQQLLDKTKEVEKINSEKNILIERQKYEVEDTKLHNNLIDLKEQELKLNKDINISKQEIKRLEEQINILQGEMSNFESNKKQIDQNKIQLSQKLTSKLREKTNLEHKISYLQESIEQNNILPNSVKSVLSNPKLNGIHNTIGSLIECDEEYTLAISTILASATSYIVVDDEKNAREAISYLKNNNLGRVTFFPLNVIKAKTIDDTIKNILKKAEGFIDVAVNLIHFDPKYKQIMENQLGNVIVVDTLEHASSISKKINNRYRVVTLDGNLIHVGGSLTGGSKIKIKNIIMEKYELENYLKILNSTIKEIQELENKINEHDDKLKKKEDQIYNHQGKIVTLKSTKQASEIDLKDKEDKYEMITSQIRDNSSMLNHSLKKEENTILEKYYKELENKNKIEMDVKNITQKRDDLNTKIEEYEFSMKKENTIFNSKTKELKELEIKITRIDVKLDHLLNELSDTYHLTYEKAYENYPLEIEEDKAREQVSKWKKEIDALGSVNTESILEYKEVNERYEFLMSQREDLTKAETTLLEIIDEMDQVMKSEFEKTFNAIQSHFNTTFKELFKGGNAKLELTDPDNLLETGIEIIASPPGKKLTTISLLSGGEKTFTAISLLFAILKSRPVPFCILDEVEAALDEVNVTAFGEYLVNLKEETQFILITHKKKTMEYVNVLYGITMQESGVSKLVSVKLEDIN